MSEVINICVHGASGKMGQAIIQAAAASPDIQVVAATEGPQSPALGAALGPLAGSAAEVTITSDLRAAVALADVVIDFTRPAGLLALVEALAECNAQLVSGTTGLSAAEQGHVAALAQQRGVVQAANFSIGVNLCVRLTELAARVLDAEADVEIIESHHRNKVDAPSGTALRLGQAVADASGRSLDEHAVKSREGNIGPRPERSIGFSTVRGGDIVGEHTVLFACEGERVEITHKATSRQNFARGALSAARWLRGQAPGLYDMVDVLNLQPQA